MTSVVQCAGDAVNVQVVVDFEKEKKEMGLKSDLEAKKRLGLGSVAPGSTVDYEKMKRKEFCSDEDEDDEDDWVLVDFDSLNGLLVTDTLVGNELVDTAVAEDKEARFALMDVAPTPFGVCVFEQQEEDGHFEDDCTEEMILEGSGISLPSRKRSREAYEYNRERHSSEVGGEFVLVPGDFSVRSFDDLDDVLDGGVKRRKRLESE